MHTFRVAALAASIAGSLMAASALAQAPTSDLPPSFSPTDKHLKWGACPDAMPKGCQVAVLNGDPSKPGADVFLKLPGKSVVPWHKHTSAERMVVVDGELRMQYEGHEPVTYKRGTYLYNPGDRVHEGRCVSAQPCVLFMAWEKAMDITPTTPSAAAEKRSTKTAASTDKKAKKGGC